MLLFVSFKIVKVIVTGLKTTKEKVGDQIWSVGQLLY